MAAKRRLEMARTMRREPVSANADGPTLGRCGSHVAKEYSLERVEDRFRYPASETTFQS